jgi:hypothetical protein
MFKFVNPCLLDECIARVKKHRFDEEQQKQIRQKKFLELVKIDGLNLETVPEHDMTEEICLEAVKQNGLALQYSIIDYDEICMAAIKQNGMALQFCGYQSLKYCLTAVKQNGLALQFVKQQQYDECDDEYEEDPMYTYKLCSAALKQNGLALKYVKDQTCALCLIAVKQNRLALKYVNVYEIGTKSYNQIRYEANDTNDTNDPND